jgi:hypothetical protein
LKRTPIEGSSDDDASRTAEPKERRPEDRGRASRVTLVFPRDFHARHFGTDNVILLGSPRSNPWFELLQHAMSLRFHWDAARRRELIRDHARKPGPPTGYQRGDLRSEANPLRSGYCVVAFLPNLARQRDVLLIGGTDAESTGAGGHLLTDEIARWPRSESACSSNPARPSRTSRPSSSHPRSAARRRRTKSRSCGASDRSSTQRSSRFLLAVPPLHPGE